MEKENRDKFIFMKDIEDIYDEMDKGSTGCFKNKYRNIYYLLNGKWHRSDGPAIEWSDGTKSWYFHGKRHRLEGPAVEWQDENKRWFYYGYKAESKEEFYDHEWRRKIEIKEFL